MTAGPQTPSAYLAGLPDKQRAEMKRVHELVRTTVPDLKPSVQAGMIGYGRYRIRYATGREVDWFAVGLAQRKNSITLVVTPVVGGKYLAESWAPKLGKADCGKSCIRFRTLDDLNEKELKALLREAQRVAKKAPTTLSI